MMATNVGMSRAKLTPNEWMALWHTNLLHAPLHRIILTAASGILSGMGAVASLKPNTVLHAHRLRVVQRRQAQAPRRVGPAVGHAAPSHQRRAR